MVTFSIYTRCKLVHADITMYVRKKTYQTQTLQAVVISQHVRFVATEAYFTPVWQQRARSCSKITEQFTEVCKTCNPRGENRQTFCSRNRCMQSSSPNVLSAGAVERVFFQSCFYEPAERTMGVLVVFFQVVAGAVASFLVGMIWFSPVTFGRIWWRYQFPGKRFGEVEKCR